MVDSYLTHNLVPIALTGPYKTVLWTKGARRRTTCSMMYSRIMTLALETQLKQS